MSANDPKPKGYTLAKMIVRGLLLLMTWPVVVSIPFAWLIVRS